MVDARRNRRAGRKKQRNALFSMTAVATGAFGLGVLMAPRMVPFPTMDINMTPPQSAPMVPSVHSREAVSDSAGSPTFLLGIFTKDSDRLNRTLIRRTYLNVTDPRFCTLAHYINAREAAAESDSPEPRCRVMYAFVVGRTDANDRRENFANEIDSLLGANLTSPFGTDEPADVVRLRITENMDHGKTPTWFRLGALLSDAYGIEYIGKADSDLIMSVPRLVRFVREYLPTRRTASDSGGGGGPSDRGSHAVYGGAFITMKEQCGFDDCSGRVYMGGPFYFASVDVVRHVVSQNRTYPIEDLDFGLRVGTYPGPVYFVELNSDTFWRHPLKTEEKFLKTWRNGRTNASAYAEYRMWPGVEDQPSPDIGRRKKRLRKFRRSNTFNRNMTKH